MKNAVEILKSSEKSHINLGLKRIKLILALLDNPQDKYKIIHVAGTNGKGSTCKIINEILIEHFKNTSIKTGLYTSPHLFSYCERIKINNIDIKPDNTDISSVLSADSQARDFVIRLVGEQICRQF